MNQRAHTRSLTLIFKPETCRCFLALTQNTRLLTWRRIAPDLMTHLSTALWRHIRQISGSWPRPRKPTPLTRLSPEHVFDVLQRLRESFEYIVLDPQHTFDSITLAALDLSDEIVLVLTLDIPAIRSTQRALEIFDRLGYPRKKIRIVVNRWSKQIDLDLRQVEKFLGEPVIGFIPSEYQTAVTSINLGQPLVKSDPSCKISMEIKRIASTLINAKVEIQEEPKLRRTLWVHFSNGKSRRISWGFKSVAQI